MRVQKNGIDQVVSGDLVYCKGESTEKVTGISSSECEGDSCNDTYECSQLDEISETVLPEEKSNSVKGAATTCYVALHPQVKGVTGEYFSDSNIAKPTAQAKDADLAKKLWDFSLSLTDPK